jgi:hypothetical protein
MHSKALGSIPRTKKKSPIVVRRTSLEVGGGKRRMGI